MTIETDEMTCALCKSPASTGNEVILAPDDKCLIVCNDCSMNHPYPVQSVRDLVLARWCSTHGEVFALCQDAHYDALVTTPPNPDL